MTAIESPVGTLTPSLRAARQVNGMGGFAEVLRRLAGFNFDAFVAVVAAGTGKKVSEVEDAVYETGLPSLVEPLSQFVECLLNGGKPIKPAATP